MKKKIIIIGAGISGLSAGIYGQKLGYDTLILEKNPSVGGLCTAWDRKGHHLDGCMHWLTGTQKGTELRSMWETVGAIESDDDLLFLDSWGSFEYEGEIVTLYRDINKVEEEWLRRFPIDKKPIKKFVKLVKKVMRFELPLEAPPSLLGIKRSLRFLKDLLLTFPFYEIPMLKSCSYFANKFKTPVLRWAINHAQPGPGNLYSMIFSYATICLDNGGLIKGGSKPMVERMAAKYKSLGGELKLNSEVISVNIVNKECFSLTLKNGESFSADYYISCCDANYVTRELLHDKDTFKKLSKRYNSPYIYPTPSAVLVYLLIKDLKDIPIPFSFPCKNFTLAGRVTDHITMRSYDYDPYFKSNEGSVVQVFIDQYSKSFPFWEKLYLNKDEYNKTKNEIAQLVIEKIEERFINLKDKISVLDVVTPITFNKYTNASRGAYMGFLFTPKKVTLTFKGKIKSAKNFLLSGQFAQCPGGLPLALSSGRFSIQWIKYSEQPLIKRLFIKNINKIN